MPSLLFHPSKMTVSMLRAVPTPNSITEWSSYSLSSPFAFSMLFFPPAQLPAVVCGAGGDYQAGARTHPKEQKISACGWVCEAQVI